MYTKHVKVTSSGNEGERVTWDAKEPDKTLNKEDCIPHR